MFQEVNLFLGEVTPAAARQVLLSETGEINAVQLHHVVTQRLEYTANDAVATRVDFDAGLFAVGGGDVAHCIGVDGSVVELNAIGDVLHVLLADGLVGPNLVDFLLDILRVGELGCQVTVVGEQEHTGCVAVKTSNGINALLAGTLHEIHDGLAAIGIIAGGDGVLGLVKQDVALLLGCYDLAVVLHNVLWGDLHAELGHYDIIDHHKALLDIFISNTARADACIGQELVQANLHVGIDCGLLIDDALGLGSETHLGFGTLLAFGTLLVSTLALLVTTLLTLIVATLLTLVITALTLLIATLSLLVASLLTLVVATLSLLVTALTGLIAALTLLVTALTGLIATLSLLVAALTGLITLTGLVATLLLLFGVHGIALGILGLFALSLWLLETLLVTGLVATLTLLVTTLTGLIATLTLLVATLTGLVTLTMVAALSGLIAFLLLITFCGC